MSKTSAPLIEPNERLRILFYLPVVTPWWFENIVVHLIRNLAQSHEVHVMVPPLWRNTGLGPDEIPLITDLEHVHWLVLDGPDHPCLRDDASGQNELFELANQINPHITLCRSADTKTPPRFPGILRYIMEGAAPPFTTHPNWIWLAPSLFDHGIMPDLPAHVFAKLDTMSEPHWTQMLQTVGAAQSEEFLAQIEQLRCSHIIGLALEYEHEENFFGQHHLYADNAAMIRAIAKQLGDNCVLAVTNHPLTELHGDTRAVKAAIAELSGKAVLLKQTGSAGETTLALAQNCSGMIIGNSKVWATCAAVGAPMLRRSGFATGDWTGAYNEVEPFLDAVMAGDPAKADPMLARRWFTFHLANNVFDPAAPDLAPNDIIARIIHPAQPERWANGMDRYRAQADEIRRQAAGGMKIRTHRRHLNV